MPLALWAFVTVYVLEKSNPTSPVSSTLSIRDARTWPSVGSGPASANDNKSSPPQCLFHVLLFSTALLVAINSYLYLALVQTASEHADSLGNNGRGFRRLAFWLGLVATLGSTAWVFDIIFAFLPRVTHEHEIAGLVIFAVFLFIDLVLFVSFRRQSSVEVRNDSMDINIRPDGIVVHSDKDKAELVILKKRSLAVKRAANYHSGQAFYIDLPVVVGMLAVLFLSTAIVNRWHAGDLSLELGLSCGATVMHIAMSQFIFFIVSAREVIQQRRDEADVSQFADQIRVTRRAEAVPAGGAAG